MRRRRSEIVNTVEDETLSQIAIEAEARLAQKRTARIEARKMRMQELIKKQCENESTESDVNSVTGTPRISSSAASSVPPPDTNRVSNDLESSSENQDLQNAFNDLQEKYREAMIHSAQLENERSQLNYHCELLKDVLEEQEDNLYRVTAEHKTTCQDLERQKRSYSALEKKCYDLQEGIHQRDHLIKEHGIDVGDDVSREVVDGGKENIIDEQAYGDSAQDQSAEEDSLESQLRHLCEEKQILMEEVQRLTTALEEKQRKENMVDGSSSVTNEEDITDLELISLQREANKQASEYKLRLQKSEQDLESLQSHVSRLEVQLHRVKQTAEVYEKNEDEMRAEKRRLARDLRTALDRIEELQMINFHLEKRLERMRATRASTGQT